MKGGGWSRIGISSVPRYNPYNRYCRESFNFLVQIIARPFHYTVKYYHTPERLRMKFRFVSAWSARLISSMSEHCSSPGRGVSTINACLLHWCTLIAVSARLKWILRGSKEERIENVNFRDFHQENSLVGRCAAPASRRSSPCCSSVCLSIYLSNILLSLFPHRMGG